VKWSASFTTDTPGVTMNWQWAAAVYTSFDTDSNNLGVKPVDDNHASVYQNSDHAGTPENFETFVTGGATGGGGSNFTGSYSGTGSPAITVAPISIAPFTYLGFQLQGTTSAPTGITLTNNSGVALTITGFSTTGNFAKTTDTCAGSLAAGASCTINVTFTPTAGGTRTGTLTITDNASNSPQTVYLSGDGN